MYDTTAFLYESIATFEEPEAACGLVHDWLGKAGVTPPALLGDLGAGTGLMALMLARRGWSVWGVERSPAMLAEALKNTAKQPAPVQARLSWEQGDIRYFAMPGDLRLDGAVCLCNTINHLVAREEVLSFIQAAYRALKPGGVLILDSDTLQTFQGFFHHEPTVVWDDGLHRLTRACRFEPATGCAEHIALLERVEDGIYRQVSQEAMTLRYHPEPELFAAFLAEGFQIVATEPFNPNPKLYVGFVPKLLWVLKKPDSTCMAGEEK